jgi:hypothetical protein
MTDLASLALVWGVLTLLAGWIVMRWRAERRLLRLLDRLDRHAEHRWTR